MLNRVVIVGRLTADPEVRMTQSGKPVATFTLAVERDFKGADGQREADFINCVAWNNTADFAKNYFFKGNMTIVSGRLQTRRWEGSDGKKGTATELIVENMYFGESKKSDAPATNSFQPIEVADEDELPW